MRERVALQAARAAGLPAPAVEAFGAWQDRPAVVLSWCSGQTLMRCMERKPWTVLRLSRQLGRLQARIHTVPVPKPFEGAPAYWLARRRRCRV
jgi:tRNA A-37 threonylcarbamoyl transferase component Bud32